jgi:hypothetical protein
MIMDAAWEEKVRERAYAIWERQGCPDGRAEQFWLMAEEELLAEGQAPAPEMARRNEPDQPTGREGVQSAADEGLQGAEWPA